MLTIRDHLLVDCPYVPAADHGGTFDAGEPQFIILHYTAGTSFDSDLTQLTADDSTEVSSHLLIDRDGYIAQLVPFNIVAWHAGVSSWEGYESLNYHSIGIELVNPGYAREGINFDGPTIHAAHKNGGEELDWYLYTDEQVLAVVDCCKALMRAYPTITEVIGHDDVAPDRKVDPGPAWDWEAFNALLYATEPGIGDDKLEQWFTWKPPSSDLDPILEGLYGEAYTLARLITDQTPYSSEQILALRRLRECLMYCTASLTR